jgi:hypothetical protein
MLVLTDGIAVMTTPLPLQGLEGQVLRLRGVVDRLGGFQQQGRTVHTLCVRNLEVAATEQPITPDHWWFRLRQTWSEAGIQAGDTVVFTAKVRACSKGHHDPELLGVVTVRGRERVVGLAGEVRDLVIQRRGPADRLELNALQDELRRERLLRLEAEAAMARLDAHRDALLLECERLRGQVALWRNRCRRPEATPASEAPARQPSAQHRCRGFRALVGAAA